MGVRLQLLTYIFCVSLRLSKLARSRTRDKTDMGQANAGAGEIKELTKSSSTTSPYLEFISERPKKDRDNKTAVRRQQRAKHEDQELKPASSDVVDMSISNLSQQDDEESRFRNQIARIVNRAASICVKEQQQQQQTDTNTCSMGSTFLEDSLAHTCSTAGESETRNNARRGGGKESVEPKVIPSIEDELRELEAQVASVCASAVKKDDEEDTASLLSGSFFDYSTAQSTAFCSSSADTSSSYSWVHTNSSSKQESYGDWRCSFFDTTVTTDGRIAGPRFPPEPVDGPRDISKGEENSQVPDEKSQRADLEKSQVDTTIQPGRADEDEPRPNQSMTVVPEGCDEDDRCPQPRGIGSLSIQETETDADCPQPRNENNNFGVDTQRLRTANDLLCLLG